jgi:hypothetical protein
MSVIHAAVAFPDLPAGGVPFIGADGAVLVLERPADWADEAGHVRARLRSVGRARVARAADGTTLASIALYPGATVYPSTDLYPSAGG